MRWWVRASCQELVSVLCIKEIQSGTDGYIREWWYWHSAACEYICTIVCGYKQITCSHMCIRILGSDDACRKHISSLCCRGEWISALTSQNLYRLTTSMHNFGEKRQRVGNTSDLAPFLSQRRWHSFFSVVWEQKAWLAQHCRTSLSLNSVWDSACLPLFGPYPFHTVLYTECLYLEVHVTSEAVCIMWYG